MEGIAKKNENLKEKFSFALVFKFPDFTEPFKVHTDASDFAIDGVLMQNGHLITFDNKKIYGAQL
jgi:hypothetical protein